MLLMNRFDEPYSVRLRIVGALTTEAMPEVEQAWNKVVDLANGRKLILDASGITRIDPAAIPFLRRLQSEGTRVDDDGRYVQRSTGSSDTTMIRIRRRLCAAFCALVPMLDGCPCERSL